MVDGWGGYYLLNVIREDIAGVDVMVVI